MSEVTRPAPVTPSLSDPWDRTGQVPLDGPLERADLHPALTALLVPVFAWILLQIIASISVAIAVISEGVDFTVVDEAMLFEEFMGSILISNSIGQVLGLALPAVILMLLHSSRPAAFVRLRTPSVEMFGLAFLGWIALIPIVGWLGAINEHLPVPEFFRQLEMHQLAFIEQILTGDLSIVLILLTVAVTPALCEEILFRGYLQRQAERAFGVVAGIVFIGVIFALFHLRLSHILPLTALGLYLAYLAWRTGSLWIPIVIHFAHNSYTIFLGLYLQDRGIEWDAIEQMTLPWYLVVLGMVLFVAVVFLLHGRARELVRTDNTGGRE